MKRALLGLMALGPWLVGCNGIVASASASGADQQRRFKGIGVVLVLDAVPGPGMEGVMIRDDEGYRLLSHSLVSKSNRGISALGGIRVPLTVRAIWREHPKAIWGKNGGIDYEGAIIGDYTIPVAERIPNEVLDDIRAHGGALRLKFRLKPDGVLFGWDIERDGGGISKFDMAGGDFLESYY
jgi:hypothetical protein